MNRFSTESFLKESIKKEGVHMSYAIDPAMSFAEVILFYEKYIDETRAKGKTPVSFLHFLTGKR